MQDYVRIGPDGDPVLDFENLTRDQAAALQEVTVETYMEGRGKNPAGGGAHAGPATSRCECLYR
jgi:hypothetical protein